MKLIYWVLCLLSLLSCRKSILDRDMQSYVDKNKAYSDKTALQNALNGCYDGLQDYRYYGRNFIIISEVMSGNAKLATSNHGNFVSFYNYSYTAYETELDGLWKICYQIISRTNNVLEAVSKLKPDQETNRIKGEALAIRSLVYFDLVRTFAQPYNISSGVEGADGNGGHPGVPIILNVVETDSLVSPQRQPVKKVYNQIIQDLTKADSLLSNPVTPFVFNKLSVNALLSKVFLSKAQYINSFAYANKVIESNKYQLVSNSNYISSWTVASNEESIFSIVNSLSDNQGTNALGFMLDKDGYGDIVATNDLYSSFDNNDIRYSLYEKRKDIYVKKYNGMNLSGISSIPILRYSEIFLIKAEILARYSFNDKDLILSASKYLDTIRKRANPKAIRTMVSGNQLLESIALERRKELAFEGSFFHDLKRKGLSISREDCNSGICTIAFPSKYYALPIPMSEINANKNIKQNQGY